LGLEERAQVKSGREKGERMDFIRKAISPVGIWVEGNRVVQEFEAEGGEEEEEAIEGKFVLWKFWEEKPGEEEFYIFHSKFGHLPEDWPKGYNEEKG
jgi:hypothetical protein